MQSFVKPNMCHPVKLESGNQDEENNTKLEPIPIPILIPIKIKKTKASNVDPNKGSFQHSFFAYFQRNMSTQ